MKNNHFKYLLIFAFFLPVTVMASDTLTGDWGGTRSKWEDQGITLEAVYTADYFSVQSGGVNSEGEYLGNLDLTAEFDGEKLLNMSGATFFLYILGNHGHNQGGGPGQHAGDFQGLSNIDARDTIKIYELWYDQRFSDDAASIRFGLYDLNSEFDVTETAGLFINSSFGIGPDYSQSGQNGPSIFPTTSVALRLAYQVADKVYLQAAVLDGVPGDPNDYKGTHIKFNSGDGLLYAGEIGYTQGGEGDSQSPYGKLALGMWRYSEGFDDLVDTDGSGNPVKRKNNQGVYLIGEYTVYQESSNPEQGLALFARYGVANDDINQIASYYGLGLVYTGLIDGRDEDQVGLAIAVANNGDKYKQAQQSSGSPVEDHETVIEFSYRAQLLTWLAIQPDVQWIKNPGMNPAIKDATVIGLRTEVVF